ncbi:hypothetical protein GF322_00135 [Candidatus Dependentiae bacterium]|nr:hypothetical protein [Candidatus Dependentiae bacterium]
MLKKLSVTFLFIFNLNYAFAIKNDLNQLNENGYTPLHEAIINDEKIQNIELFLNAIKDKTSSCIKIQDNNMVASLNISPNPITRETILDVDYEYKFTSKDENDYSEYNLNLSKKLNAQEIEELIAENQKELKKEKDNQLTQIKSLLKSEAKVDLPDSYGRTPLWWACERNNVKVTELLIKKGAEINKQTPDGWTPLHVAACDGNLEIVELLLKNKASVNIQDNEGETALHVAANIELKEKTADYLVIIKALLDSDADKNIKNNNDQTAVMIAKAADAPKEIIDVLEK